VKTPDKKACLYVHFYHGFMIIGLSFDEKDKLWSRGAASAHKKMCLNPAPFGWGLDSYGIFTAWSNEIDRQNFASFNLPS
jgi:hypothetical protein